MMNTQNFHKTFSSTTLAGFPITMALAGTLETDRCNRLR